MNINNNNNIYLSTTCAQINFLGRSREMDCPRMDTDRHGNKENNLLLAALVRSKLSKLKTMSIVGREDNADNIAPKSISLGRSKKMV